MPAGKALGSATANPSGKAFGSRNAPAATTEYSFDTEAYDALNVEDSVAFVTDDNRAEVLAYERANKNRRGVLNAFEGE